VVTGPPLVFGDELQPGLVLGLGLLWLLKIRSPRRRLRQGECTAWSAGQGAFRSEEVIACNFDRFPDWIMLSLTIRRFLR
jgi:hypothetical protein